MDNKCLVIPQYGCSVADLYHGERNHQGKGNKLLFPEAGEELKRTGHTVACRHRLGGLLKYYRRDA
jgi:putative transposase